MKDSAQAKPWKGIAAAVTIGTLAALLICAGTCLLCALLMKKQVIPAQASGVCAAAICAVATAAGCALAQRRAGRWRLPVSLAAAAMISLCFLLIRAAMRTTAPASWTGAAVIGICAVLPALIGAGRGK